jgi:dTMP kinase
VSRGKYICFEGISGCGKDTQINLTYEWLESKGYKVKIVEEPTNFLRDKIKENWKKDTKNPLVDTFLFCADRAYLVENFLEPSLENGDIVLSNRSFVSNLAYQSMYLDIDFLLKMNYFVPKPDLILILDVYPEVAYSRLVKGRDELSRFEKIEKMEKLRKNFLEIKNYLDNVVILNANKEINNVQNQVRREIEKII